MYLQLAVLQAIGCSNCGKQDIDIHLLKPARFMPDQDYVILPAMTGHVVQEECLAPAQDYIMYPYCTAHPVLRWLLTKLAEWIRSNLAEELKIPEKQGDLWTAGELNAIITQNLVGDPCCCLHTFGCIQWEGELFNGRPKARCYPFDMVCHCFRNKNPKVQLLRLEEYSIQCCTQYHMQYF